jgi:hypothetical protein
VLKRRDMKEELPYPKHRRRLPVVLSPEEVPAADRRREEPLSPHAAADAVWRGLATQRGGPLEGPGHRQSAYAAARRSGQRRS